MTKKIFILSFVLAFVSTVAFGSENADTTYWTKGGSYNISFTQVSFSNWAAGGQNSISGVTQLKAFANYKKGKLAWDNKLETGYGLSYIKDAETQKIEDIFDLQTKLGLEASKYWYYTILGSFNTQFAPGYSDNTNETKVSNLFAPAYLSLSVGMDYKPNKNLTAYISPVAGKMTIVTDKDLEGSFGVEVGETYRMELGASVKTNYKVEIVKNVALDTELGLFTNYLDHPERIDVDWKVAILMSVNKYLSVKVNTHLIYDYDTRFPIEGTDKTEDLVQFKEILGIGLNFKF